MLRRYVPHHLPLRCARGALLALAALAAPAAALHAQTATFDAVDVSDPLAVGVQDVANCYVSGGLRFTVVGRACGLPPAGEASALATYTPNNAFGYTGSPALFNTTPDAVIEIMAAAGAPFSLRSIDLAPVFLFAGAPGTQSVTFTGTRLGGMTVTQSVDVPLGATTLTRATFAGFTNLTSVRFRPGDPDGAVQFDNVAAAVVPEPSTYLLLGSGLAGLLAVARRRRAAR